MWNVWEMSENKRGKYYLGVNSGCSDIKMVLKEKHETAVCHNPHNASNWASRNTGELGYKHAFCQNVVSTKKKNLLTFL